MELAGIDRKHLNVLIGVKQLQFLETISLRSVACEKIIYSFPE